MSTPHEILLTLWQRLNTLYFLRVTFERNVSKLSFVVSTIPYTAEGPRFISRLGPFCVDFACSPRVCVGSLLPPSKIMHVKKNLDKKTNAEDAVLGPWCVTAVQRNYIMEKNETACAWQASETEIKTCDFHHFIKKYLIWFLEFS